MSRCAWMLSGLLLACTGAVRAGIPEAPAFRAIGVADGLPSGSVNAIAQDAAGYLWFATADGLARYDGLGFRTWRHDPADPGSLPGNNVQALHVDAMDRVWVATEGGGLSVLDARRVGFRHFRKASHPAIGSDDAWAIASRGGDTWFGTWGGGLHRMDRHGRITRFMPVPGAAGQLPSADVLALAFDREGRLWVGTTRGLARRQDAGFESVALPGQARALVYALMPEGDALWVGSAGGVHRLARGRWADPRWGRDFPRPRAALSFARDHEGSLWIGTQEGLWRVPRLRAPLPVVPFATGAVGAVFVDRDGGLWVARPGRGLGYLRPGWRLLARFPADGGHDAVRYRAVAAAREGGVWLAGPDAPPLRLDASGRVHALPQGAHGIPARPHLRALAETADGVLWAAGGPSLWRIGREGGVRYWSVDAGRDALSGGVDLLRVAGDGSLWLAAAGVGIQQRAADGRVLRDWRAGTHGLGGADIEAMEFAADGSLWIGGQGGVARLAPGAAAFVPLAGMGRARTQALAFDGAGTAWLARATGLERYRLERDGGWRLAQRVGPALGMPAVEVAGLVVDDAHRAWASTARGLFRWDPASGRLRRFGVQDGLESREFAPRGIALAAGGMLAATTSAGDVVLLDTRARSQPPPMRPLQLAEVAVRDAGRWRLLEPTAPLELPPPARELRVRVRLLAFGQPGAIRYESRLEGRDRDWLASERGERIVAGLRPGVHALRMRAIDAEGRRSPERVLRWRVLPPWWATPWAMGAWALGSGMACALVLFALRARLRARRRIRRLAQGRALAEQASRAKSRFLADLGHEVRTPMTGVLGMAELLLDGALAPGQREHVEAIRAAGRHLLRLVDDALELARIEAGRLVLDARPFELRALLAEVAALQAPLARARGLRFVLDVEDGIPRACVGDALRLKQVLFNLLGNAIKFTARGMVGMRAEPLPGGGLRITVHDTGPGLDAAHHARVFGRFEQADGARTAARHGGSGLGLAISRELVLAMGGDLRLESAPGAGTRLVLDLPLPAAQPRAEQACTASTSAATCAGSMSGDMPWPRLNTCPSREPPLPAA